MVDFGMWLEPNAFTLVCKAIGYALWPNGIDNCSCGSLKN